MRKHFVIAGILLVGYILIVNVFNFMASASLLPQGDGTQEKVIYTGATTETADLSDTVSLSVLRKRWYGRIYETINGGEKMSNLYLLWFVKLPLRNAGISYIFLHVLFFIAMAIYVSAIGAMKYQQNQRFRRYGY